MKHIFATVLIVAALNSASALPSFDPFADATGTPGGTAYTVGAPLAPNTSTNSGGGTNGWLLAGSSFTPANPQPTVVAGNLSYTGLPASTGNSISNTPPATGSGGSARMGLNLIAASSTVYYSFILKVTDITAVPTTAVNNPIASFSDTVGGQTAGITRMGGQLETVATGSGGFYLGVGRSPSTSAIVYDTTERAVNDTLFIVVSYEHSGSDNLTKLWINPPLANLGVDPAPPPTVTGAAGVLVNDLNSGFAKAFFLSCQSAAMPSCIVDEVRVATDWAIVTGGNPIIPLTILNQPRSRTVKAGDRVGFAVAVSGDSPHYQWRRNGADLPDATSSTYPVASAQTTDAGSYTVVITNNALTGKIVTSSPPAVLTVSTTPFQLYETNLIVVRVGDGSQTLATTGNSVYLDQFTTNGTYLNSTFIPDTGASALIESGPDLAGTVITGAALTRSADKRLMTLSGYNVALGNATQLHNTFSTTVPRGVVTIDSNSQITLAVADTNAYSGAHFRGAATDGTNNFWGSGGTEGTWYFGFNSPTNVIQSTFPNTRSIDIFNGNLYTLASSTANGLLKFNGLPTTDQGIVPNALTGFTSTTTTDFSVNPTDDLIYLSVGSSIQKWQFDGSSWANSYNLTTGFPDQVRYLTVDYSGAFPVIYLTTADPGTGTNQLMVVVDTDSSAAAVTLATSGANQFYKGIRFGPIVTVARPILAYTRSGTDLILNWSGSYTLVSSTNVLGPYLDVPSATSPFTTNTTSQAAQFFGLRQ